MIMTLNLNYGKILGQVVLLAGSFWFLQKFYPQIHPLPQTHFVISKEDAIEKAQRFVKDKIPADELDISVSFSIEAQDSKKSDETIALANSLGFQPYKHWNIALISTKKKKTNLTLSSGNEEKNKVALDNWYKVTLSPEGKLLKLDFEQARLDQLKDSLKAQQPVEKILENSGENARLKAYDFLNQLGEDTTLLSLASGEVKQDSTGNIYSYLFSRTIEDQKIQQQIKLTDSGTIIFYEYLIPKTEGVTETNISEIIAAVLQVAVYVTLVILLVIYLIQFSRRESISFELALPLGYTIGIITLLHSLFSQWHSPIGELLLETFIPSLFLALVMWLLYAISDATARQQWDDKLAISDQFLHGKFFGASVGRAILRGLTLGTYALTIQVVLLYLYKVGMGGELKTAETLDYSFIIIFPAMVGALQVFSKAMFNEFFLRLFGVSLLKKWFRQNHWIFLAGTIFAVIFSAELKAVNEWIQFLVNLLPNFLFILFLVKYEIVTTIVGYFSYQILSKAIIFSHTGESYFQELGTAFYFLLAFLLVSACLIVIFRRREEQTTSRFIPDYIRKKEERDRLLRELEIARTVQQKFLPATTPELPNFQIAAFCQPAWEVGGDYFDYFPLEDGRLGIAIGDVSNKGVSAAFYMTMVKGFLKALATQSLEPARILSETNALFYENVERGNFISMVYGILDSQSGEFTFARAGHNPVLYLLGKSASGQWLSPKGVGIGLLPAKEFRAHITQEKIKMQTGEILILYTDGYPEAMNEQSEQFGEENLQEFIQQQFHLPALDIIQTLEMAIKKWEGNRTALDDRTMVVIKKIK